MKVKSPLKNQILLKLRLLKKPFQLVLKGLIIRIWITIQENGIISDFSSIDLYTTKVAYEDCDKVFEHIDNIVSGRLLEVSLNGNAPMVRVVADLFEIREENFYYQLERQVAAKVVDELQTIHSDSWLNIFKEYIELLLTEQISSEKSFVLKNNTYKEESTNKTFTLKVTQLKNMYGKNIFLVYLKNMKDDDLLELEIHAVENEIEVKAYIQEYKEWIMKDLEH